MLYVKGESRFFAFFVYMQSSYTQLGQNTAELFFFFHVYAL